VIISIYQNLFDGNNLKKGVTWADYQNQINNKYDQILSDTAGVYGQNSNEYRALQQQVNNQKFIKGQGSRDIDNKLGNFTSSRPNFTIDLATPEQLADLNKRGIVSYSQLRAQDPEMYKAIVGNKTITSDAYIGKIPTSQPPSQQPTVSTTALNIPATQGNQFGSICSSIFKLKFCRITFKLFLFLKYNICKRR